MEHPFLKALPAVRGTGFQMEGYHVWCGSVLEENGTYYLFAARWKKEKSFPSGYMTDSEIVLATTDDLNQPFVFQKVVIGKRDGGYWDSMMAHNPYITKIDSEYVLFYIGNPDGRPASRKIGWARTKNLLDEWERSDSALDLPPDANNPCAVPTKDGVLLYFRDGNLKVSVAKAEHYDGTYRIWNDNLFPEAKIEDMFVYETNSGFVMIAEDNAGYFTGLKKGGVAFRSDDGIFWDRTTARKAYDFSVPYTDGTVLALQRRERPFLLFDKGKTYLFNAAKINGETTETGGDTWNMLVEVEFG